MTLKLEHEVRDPIHGLIRLTDQEMSLVNSQPFQRLRRIRQLAMADLVYPGAVHTRFEHSLGTLHTAYRIVDHLRRQGDVPEEDVRVVRLAALLHDTGHGPFSHVSEYLLDQHSERHAVGEVSVMEKIHEKITVDIINKVDDIAKLVSDEDRKLITSIIAGGKTRDYKKDVVSSDLDADKMDYLLRDAHYAGVRYGLFDLDKVIDVCKKYKRDIESYLVIREEGIFAVEQLVLAKHYMTHQVYAHRIRTITDTMIVRGLELAIQDGYEDIKKLFSYDGSKDFLKYYLEFDDGLLMSKMMNQQFPRPMKIFQRLRQRKLYKEVAEIRLDALDVPDLITRVQLLHLNSEQIAELEARIAKMIRCEPWEVILHKKSIKHPAYQQSSALEPDAITVLMRDGSSKAMSDFPDLISPRVSQTERLHVIAPVEVDGLDIKDKVRKLVFDSVGGVQ